MSNGRKVVLDASAAVAWLLRERGWQTIDRLLKVAVLPAPTLVETLYRVAEKGYRSPPAALYVDLVQLGVHIEPLLAEDAPRAAELIASSRAQGDARSLSLGDGLCIAVAERLALVLTGGDQLWEQLDLRVPFQAFR